jgi:hypothetical protein
MVMYDIRGLIDGYFRLSTLRWSQAEKLLEFDVAVIEDAQARSVKKGFVKKVTEVPFVKHRIRLINVSGFDLQPPNTPVDVVAVNSISDTRDSMVLDLGYSARLEVFGKALEASSNTDGQVVGRQLLKEYFGVVQSYSDSDTSLTW